MAKPNAAEEAQAASTSDNVETTTQSVQSQNEPASPPKIPTASRLAEAEPGTSLTSSVGGCSRLVSLPQRNRKRTSSGYLKNVFAGQHSETASQPVMPSWVPRTPQANTCCASSLRPGVQPWRWGAHSSSLSILTSTPLKHRWPSDSRNMLSFTEQDQQVPSSKNRPQKHKRQGSELEWKDPTCHIR